MSSNTAEILKMEIPLQAANLTQSLATMAEAIPGVEASLNEGPLTTLQQFDKAVNAAEKNPNLSAEGKHDAVQQAARAALASLDTFTRNNIDVLKMRIANVERRVVPAFVESTDPTERLIIELRRQEIRGQLRGLDPLEREVVYLGASEAIRDAMETGPPTLIREQPDGPARLVPFVSSERVAERRLADAEAINPERFGELRDLQVITRVLTSAVATARSVLTAVLETPPNPTDSVAAE